MQILNQIIAFSDVFLGKGDFTSLSRSNLQDEARCISLNTFRKRSCRKVMVSQECVKHSVHGGGGGIGWRCTHTPSLGRHFPWADTTPPARHPLARHHTPLVRHHPPGQTPHWSDTTRPGQTPPPSQTPPPGQTPPGQTPPPQQMATAADGMHPTGMHSCCRILLHRLDAVLVNKLYIKSKWIEVYERFCTSV